MRKVASGDLFVSSEGIRNRDFYPFLERSQFYIGNLSVSMRQQWPMTAACSGLITLHH